MGRYVGRGAGEFGVMQVPVGARPNYCCCLLIPLLLLLLLPLLYYLLSASSTTVPPLPTPPPRSGPVRLQCWLPSMLRVLEEAVVADKAPVVLHAREQGVRGQHTPSVSVP